MAKPLSEHQQSIIDTIAASLPLRDQYEFRHRVFEHLETVPEIGDGIVHRICAFELRPLFRPPADDVERHTARQLNRFR